VARVAIVTRAFNRLEYTMLCVRNVQKLAGYEDYVHIILEQNSTDGTKDWLRSIEQEGFYKVRVQYNKQNLGDADGMWQGYGLIDDDCEYIMQFDNDCMPLDQGWLDKLVRVMDSNPKVGALMMFREGVRSRIKITAIEDFHGIRIGDVPKVTCCFITRTALLSKFEQWEYRRGVDWGVELSTRIKPMGFELKKAPDIRVQHIDSTRGQHQKYPMYFGKVVARRTNQTAVDYSEVTEDAGEFVTFIIPSLGRSTLTRALKSLHAQTVDRWKAIVCFETGVAPTIESEGKVSVYASGYEKNARVNSGVTRNYAITKADTEWLAFIDDDDAATTDYVECLEEEIRNNPGVAVVVFRMVYPNKRYLPVAGFDMAQLRQGHIGVSFAVRRELCDKYKFVSGRRADFKLLKALKEGGGHKFVVSDKLCYLIKMPHDDKRAIAYKQEIEQQLRQYRESGDAQIPDSSKATHPMSKVAIENRCEVIAEVGVLAGRTTRDLFRECPQLKLIHMIDPWLTYAELQQADTTDKKLLNYDQVAWDRTFEKAKAVALENLERCRVHRKSSFEASFDIPDRSLDMAIIDADHGYRSARLDIIRWTAKVKDGGILAGHDYVPGWQSVMDAVNDTIGADNITKLSRGYWYIQITPENRKMIYDRI